MNYHATIAGTRRLLQEDSGADAIDTTLSDNSGSIKTHFPPSSNTPSAIDSSMALTILVLLTALFFLAFFSIYIRRFSGEDSFSSTPNRRLGNPSPAPPQSSKGLDPSTIKSLPLVACGTAAKHRIEECTICLSEFEEGETVKIIPYCKHVFHPMCIDTWLSMHVTCPLCRSPRLLERVDEVSLCVKQQQNNNGVSGFDHGADGA